MKTSKRVNEPTPNGGAYSVVYFKDKDGNPCSESAAKHVEIIEYDENDEPIMRTYA